MSDKKELGEKVMELKNQGLSWSKVAKELGVSVSTCKRRLEEVKTPSFPIYKNATIRKLVPNPRLCQVIIDNEVVVATMRVGLNRRPGQTVTVEQIDEKNYRIV